MATFLGHPDLHGGADLDLLHDERTRSCDWRIVAQKLEVKGTPKVYVIRNSFLKPVWETVKPKIMPIAGISIGYEYHAFES